MPARLPSPKPASFVVMEMALPNKGTEGWVNE